jgi:hypothetical protein
MPGNNAQQARRDTAHFLAPVQPIIVPSHYVSLLIIGAVAAMIASDGFMRRLKRKVRRITLFRKCSE